MCFNKFTKVYKFYKCPHISTQRYRGNVYKITTNNKNLQRQHINILSNQETETGPKLLISHEKIKILKSIKSGQQ